MWPCLSFSVVWYSWTNWYQPQCSIKHCSVLGLLSSHSSSKCSKVKEEMPCALWRIWLHLLHEIFSLDQQLIQIPPEEMQVSGWGVLEAWFGAEMCRAQSFLQKPGSWCAAPAVGKTCICAGVWVWAPACSADPCDHVEKLGCPFNYG